MTTKSCGLVGQAFARRMRADVAPLEAGGAAPVPGLTGTGKRDAAGARRRGDRRSVALS
ncbi:hypothetical protein [Pandoraea sputorum]|uniref:hypothetical protein n=1 Tax=Pandoraea sputorum TaxID=93222 RepID=UPI002B308BF8|nr:hypothetical protein THI4931_38710 [Pandoraea sputorum]